MYRFQACNLSLVICELFRQSRPETEQPSEERSFLLNVPSVQLVPEDPTAESSEGSQREDLLPVPRHVRRPSIVPRPPITSRSSPRATTIHPNFLQFARIPNNVHRTPIRVSLTRARRADR